MARIRHIALSTQDPDKTAKFYVDTFGLKQIGRIDNPNTSGYYLSDGELNLAILKFKNDAVAGAERGKDWVGIHHFGFQVESLEEITGRLAAAGSKPRDDINQALGVRRVVVVSALRDRDPPEAHGAARVEAHRLAERPLGLVVIERVDQP